MQCAWPKPSPAQGKPLQWREELLIATSCRARAWKNTQVAITAGSTAIVGAQIGSVRSSANQGTLARWERTKKWAFPWDLHSVSTVWVPVLLSFTSAGHTVEQVLWMAVLGEQVGEELCAALALSPTPMLHPLPGFLCEGLQLFPIKNVNARVFQLREPLPTNPLGFPPTSPAY